MRAVVDTSALFALVNHDDANHAAAVRAMAQVEEAIVPLPVLVEFFGLLGHKVGRTAPQQAYRNLVGSGLIRVVATDAISGCIELWSAHPGLTLADCVGLQACLAHQAPLLSFDRRQLAAWRRLARRA